MILIRNELYKYFSTIDSECEYVQWFKLSKLLFGSNEDIVFGAVYIPPVNSDYSVVQIYELFYSEVDHFSRANRNVILLGDFNARTSCIVDYTETDADIYEFLDINSEDVFQSDIVEQILKYNFALTRKSQDNKVNRYGRNLIECCKSNELIILNGRAFSDKGIGKTTCKNSSVVDYVISSVPMLKYLSYFEIKEFCLLYSDSHCPSEFRLKISNSLQNNSRVHSNVKVKPWTTSLSSNFESNIDVSEVNTINDMLLNNERGGKEMINEIMTKIEHVFSNSAEKTFGTYERTFENKTNTNKKWFDNDCRSARKQYHRAKKSYSLLKNDVNYTNLKRANKQYKTAIKKSNLKYKREFRNKIRQMRTSSPKDYWNYVNSINKKTAQPDINIQVLTDFFKNLNENNSDNDVPPNANYPNIIFANELNSEISQSEILKAIKALKNNKTPGVDRVLNEYIKQTSTMFLPIYHKLFNMIFDSGILPDSWLVGIIKPIYKNKGNADDPSNYRPITILSCMGKLFTAVLNQRLTSFIEENNLLNENQCGFRKGYSTCDNIFVLHAIIEYMKVRKLKLFSAFVDFEKAFDSVWRVALWSKLIKYNINGKILNIIKNMYSNIKSCVNFNGEQSKFFDCNNGLRQGENLSPILFSLFLNDAEDFLSQNPQVGLNIYDQHIYSFLKIIVLLYADDTVLFAENENELEILLKDFWNYCDAWKLNINVEKTKIMVFGERIRRKHFMEINNKIIEIVDTFKYLGVLFSKSRSFSLTKNM